jgi:hypothetical protein
MPIARARLGPRIALIHRCDSPLPPHPKARPGQSQRPQHYPFVRGSRLTKLGRRSRRKLRCRNQNDRSHQSRKHDAPRTEIDDAVGSRRRDVRLFDDPGTDFYPDQSDSLDYRGYRLGSSVFPFFPKRKKPKTRGLSDQFSLLFLKGNTE